MTARVAALSSISMFSGCGGLDYGLERSGFTTLAAVDMDKDCVASFKANFPMADVRCEDIVNWPESDMQRWFEQFKRPVALLAAGPPCPPFSKSRFWRTDLPKGFADPAGAGSFRAVLAAIRIVRPLAFLIENVKGLTYRGHRAALDSVIKEAESLGYSVNWTVVNAANYGVPQMRERCFVVGLLGGKPFEFPAPSHAKEPAETGLAPWVTAGDVLNDIDTEEAADTWGHTAGGRFKHLLEELPPGENYLYFTAERGYPNPQFKWRSRYWTYLLKLSPDLPSWTIQAKRTNNMGPLHWRNRVLRIEEVKRLQSFPDDFRLFGDVNKKWRQLGNAVPPILAEAIGRAIATQLRSADTWTAKVA
ncbi:DNA cytosine methyltransferase [Neorhizobium sp. BETTINA12A]|uniref:DNA cytosine methyltransferase n=1 Tax=Neorhizobium sp. BETTINA12A TaxID=2908924 RepID=UPI001FF30C75|nr:DNA cytosine methyltransferase [Neorhizobium sp. BETTINA12A]MCJ9753566.1 DNA cytosine methyltransferase [Neorhizobium sp. BETTINA12A]